MPQSQLNKLLTEGVKKMAAFNKAKREIEQWDNKFRAYINPELVMSPKDEPNHYKE